MRTRRRGLAIIVVTIVVGGGAAGTLTAVPAWAANCSTPATAQDHDYTVPFGVPFTVRAPGLLTGALGNTLHVQVSWGPAAANPDPSDDLSLFGNAAIAYGASPATKDRDRNGGFTYTPDPDPGKPFTGIDAFDYGIIDACGNEDWATAYVAVTPTVVDVRYSTAYNVELRVPAAKGFVAKDKGFDPLSITYDPTTAHGGTVDGATYDGSFTYTPPDGFTGTDSFGYSVWDINGDNEYDATVSIDVLPGPPAPSAVTGTPGNGRVSVSFAGSSGTGRAVSSYTVTASPGGTTLTGPSSPLAVTGLVNGTRYTFTVHATDAGGNGPESAPSAPVTPRTTPGTPLAVGAAPGNGSAVVRWKPPASTGGAPVTGYVVRAYSGSAPAVTRTYASPKTTQTFTGLVNGRSYTFRVSARNVAGAGAPSAPSGTVVAGAPGTPGSVVAIARTGGALVRWITPANNGAPITGYVIVPYQGSRALPARIVGTATSATITGLARGQAFAFRVFARNARGNGPSVLSNIVTTT